MVVQWLSTVDLFFSLLGIAFERERKDELLLMGKEKRKRKKKLREDDMSLRPMVIG